MTDEHEPGCNGAHMQDGTGDCIRGVVGPIDDSYLPWARPFGKRCRARLAKCDSPAGGHRFGRCELQPHGPEFDHALEYGMYALRWRVVGDPLPVRNGPA